MKTSNKLLLAFLLATVLFISWFVVSAKLHENKNHSPEMSGNQVSEQRASEPFSKLIVDGKFDVKLVQDSVQKIELTGDENILPEVVTEVSGGALTVKLNANYKGTNPIQALIYMKEIEALDFSAGAVLSTEEMISGEKLSLKSTSGSVGEIALNYQEFTCESSSGSSLKLSGTVGFMELGSSSGSVVRAGYLQSIKCRVKSSSGSEVEVYAKEELSAAVSSGGALTYSGEPAITNFNTSAGGSVRKK